MAYSVNTGTGDFFAPTFSASDFTKERYQLPGGSADSGFEWGDRWAYSGSDPFWQNAFGNANNYMPYFGDDGSLDSLMVKSGDKTGTVFDYTTQNGQYVPTGMGSQEWDTNSSFQNMGLAGVLGGALGGAYLSGAFGGAPTAATTAAPSVGSAGLAEGIGYASQVPGAVGGAMDGAAGAVAGGFGEGSMMGLEGYAGAAPTAASGAMTGASVLNGAQNLVPNDISKWFPLAGAAIGALAPRDAQTTTSQTQLPPWLQQLGPQFAQLAGQVGSMPYPGQAGFNADQNAAFQQYRDQASSPLLGATSNQLQSTLNGDYLKPESNPYLKGMIDQATQRAGGAVNSAFNKGGAWGGSANQELLGRTIGETTNNLNYTNYNAERGRQMTAAGLAPGVNSAQQMNTTNLLGAGNQQQQFAQQGLNGPMDWGMKQLGAYGAPFGFNQGNTTTQTQPGPSAFQNIMGGLLTGGAASRWWG
jgi:hypothetical protein